MSRPIQGFCETVATALVMLPCLNKGSSPVVRVSKLACAQDHHHPRFPRILPAIHIFSSLNMAIQLIQKAVDIGCMVKSNRYLYNYTKKVLVAIFFPSRFLCQMVWSFSFLQKILNVSESFKIYTFK